MDEMRSILKQLFSAYVNSQVSEGTAAIYYRLLRDIPPQALQLVVDQCIAELKFLPTVAEIREMYGRLGQHNGQLAAAEAWGLVAREIRRVGSYGKPAFEDATVAKVVQIIGWRDLCISENPSVDRAQFMRIYDQLVQRTLQDSALLPHVRRLLDTAQPGRTLPNPPT